MTEEKKPELPPLDMRIFYGPPPGSLNTSRYEGFWTWGLYTKGQLQGSGRPFRTFEEALQDAQEFIDQVRRNSRTSPPPSGTVQNNDQN